jgi:hypothetical protein
LPIYVPFRVLALGEAALIIWVKAVKRRTCNIENIFKAAMMAYGKELKLDPVPAKYPKPKLER